MNIYDKSIYDIIDLSREKIAETIRRYREINKKIPRSTSITSLYNNRKLEKINISLFYISCDLTTD
jgi:hypothetical protein